MQAAIHLGLWQIMLLSFGLLLLFATVFILRAFTELRPRVQLILALLSIGVAFVGWRQVHRLNKGIVVVKSAAPNGTEMCVIQRCNWGMEGWWTTGFYYRIPGKPWGWFYYSHQDSKMWGEARVDINTNLQEAVFHRNGTPAITFNWKTETYHKEGRTLTGAQLLMPPEWSPPD